LPVEGPYNNFPLTEADRYLFLAGGIGITPILAMTRRLRAAGTPFDLVYCARSSSMMAYRAEIASWSDPRVRLHADDENGGPIDVGAVLRKHAGALVYCCGPEGLIAAVEEQASELSLVRVERFRAAPRPEGDAGSAFDVVLAATGDRFRIEDGQSILDVLGSAGLDVPSSCREGICGTCETKVVSGTPDHRDSVLTGAERAENCSMMICVSRAKGDEIVLDL
jgi:ferredoxin-NADP reductase